MRRTLDSVAAQTVRPDLWVIVDDGSSDETGEIARAFADSHAWARVITRPDRGRRAVGPGVVDAFLDGLSTVDVRAFDYICKLDLDLDLPPSYFEILIDRMAAEPRLGICSGKPYYRAAGGDLRPEVCGDEMAVGMTKFYRRACYDQIGGLVREVMWDAIDCHKARSLGWIARSWDEPELRFEHLRRMGSSQAGLMTGRRRHGYGQYFMGAHWLFLVAAAAYRMLEPPYVVGGLAMLQGYFGAMFRGAERQADKPLIDFIRRYQLRALRVGKARAIAEIEELMRPRWRPDAAPAEAPLPPTP